MSVEIPPVLVLIVCKTLLVAPPDDNARFTGWEDREWATENSMMICRRHEIQMYDPANDAAADAVQTAPNFSNRGQCARAGIRLSKDWDDSHRSGPWRVWRVACPTPIIDTRTGQVIGYKLPECGHRDTVVCEQDTVI